MKKMLYLLFFTIVFCVLLTHTVDGKCICSVSFGSGRYCGKTLNIDSKNNCVKNNIYQCPYKYAKAYSYGPCKKGCQTTPAGQNDKCKS